MPNETELKKAWNLIIDYCESNDINCESCIFYDYCRDGAVDDRGKIEVSNEE